MLRSLIGRTGEYTVAAQLSRRGWVALMTFGNTPGVDLLAWHPDRDKESLVAVQVKTADTSRQAFQVKPEHEDHSKIGSYWFVFVKLNKEFEQPDLFVVPGDTVAAILFAVRRRHEVAGKSTSWHRVIHPSWIAAYQGQDAWDVFGMSAHERRQRTDSQTPTPEAKIAEAIRLYGRPEDREAISLSP